MYQLLLYVHIICAVIWVGGAFYSQLLAVRVSRSTDPGELPRLGHHLSALGMRVFLPASLLLFVAGLAMVIQNWRFSDLWISISMGLWLVSVLVGALYLGPTGKKVAERFQAEGPASEAARAGLQRIFLVSRLELVMFAVIIALMVFKPGTGGAA